MTTKPKQTFRKLKLRCGCMILINNKTKKREFIFTCFKHAYNSVGGLR